MVLGKKMVKDKDGRNSTLEKGRKSLEHSDSTGGEIQTTSSNPSGPSHLKIFHIYSSRCQFVRRSETVCAIFIEGIMTTKRLRPITTAHLEPSALQGFSFFFQDWWAQVTHGAKNGESFSEMMGPGISN